MTIERIAVIGLGYIGLPTAAAFAIRGKTVTGVDINAATVQTINQGRIHIVEPYLDTVVRTVVAQGKLKAVTVPEQAEAFIIAVPTPFMRNHEPDLRCVEAACRSIAPVLKKGDLVVLESTSPVGTTERMAAVLASARPDISFPHQAGACSDVRMAYCPERVLPGNVMRELQDNDRIIGGMTRKCSMAAVDLYRNFVKGECFVTTPRTAEMCKLTENSFRDINIAFANELSMICNTLQVNVWELIALANRHPRVNILQPGAGVGGHCIAVDPWFIVDSAPKDAKLIRAARHINDRKPKWVVEQVRSAVRRLIDEDPSRNESNITVACFGLAFKPDIDDLRESPALQIAMTLSKTHTGSVISVEPHIARLPARAEKAKLQLVDMQAALQLADIVVLLVKHGKFNSLLIQPKQIVVQAYGKEDLLPCAGSVAGVDIGITRPRPVEIDRVQQWKQ